MRAARLYGPRDVRVEQIDEPQLRAGAVRVRIQWAGLCGTDLYYYEHDPEGQRTNATVGTAAPHTLGHEMTGVVAEVAAGVVSHAPGDRVVVMPMITDGTCGACCRGEQNLCDTCAFIGLHGGGGAFSDFIVVDEHQVFRVPESMTTRSAVLIEPLASSWHAVSRASITTKSRVAVIGGGPVGLGVLLALRARGTADVVLVEPSPRRRQLAASWGVQTLDPFEHDLLALSTAEGMRFDAVFDAFGLGAEALRNAISAMRRGGTLVMIAHYHHARPIELVDVVNNEKNLIGAAAYTRADFQAVIDALASGELDPSGLVTREILLDDLVLRGLDDLLAGEARASEVKIVVRVDEAAAS